MITECTIKTKLHVAACSGANASDGTSTMRPWGFDGLALEQLNNPVTSVERIPHNIADDAADAEWMNAFVAATAAGRRHEGDLLSSALDEGRRRCL